jgi:hypothetical protein
MNTANHQWDIFQKGRLKITACACCGEIKLPRNKGKDCEHTNINSSPLVKAGYTLSTYLPISKRLVA